MNPRLSIRQENVTFPPTVHWQYHGYGALGDNFRLHQKVQETNIGDTVFIGVIRLDLIYDHQLAERTRNPPQPPDLLFAFCRVWYFVG